MEAWCDARLHSRPGKPTDNGYIESFNGRFRDECLNVHQFYSLEDARTQFEAWQIDYNQNRLYSALGHLASSEYAQCRQVTSTSEATLSQQ